MFTLDNIAAAARQFIQKIGVSRVLAFIGEMGAGKTTFIKAICTEWGVRDAVSSPTFSIINPYQTQKGTIIYHMDLYRVKDEDEAINAGIEDCLLSGNTCLIEWPDKIPGLLPPGTLFISIEPAGTTTRKITIK
ncbi:MAG: tRNA (adenosine(37)-N6)-threonylcarbamoyltransferase complex ATPase subunit type 1 TsaE [Chitinophagaceae bacterium]|nr:tRNA (adenosine(37)-N6)-threonylcarbamoyltransferase complex ATPase subunit type 1 TsaE [Chitinophagaceae bacterium]